MKYLRITGKWGFFCLTVFIQVHVYLSTCITFWESFLAEITMLDLIKLMHFYFYVLLITVYPICIFSFWQLHVNAVLFQCFRHQMFIHCTQLRYIYSLFILQFSVHIELVISFWSRRCRKTEAGEHGLPPEGAER